MNANRLASEFVNRARQNPAQSQEICREAALTFMGLAHEQKNASSSKQLAQMGLAFADAASRPAYMDDFSDLLHETAQAYQEVGDDPMELLARRREIHEARTPLEPGQIEITPRSFNRDATLGRSALIKFAPTQEEISQGILQSQNVAFWQGTKKEAQAMTVDVSLGFLPPVPPESTFTSVRPFAEVEYGSDGNRTKVKFDVAFGKRVTVVGNYIAVTVGTQSPGPAPYVTVPITAGASIGAFAAPSHGPVVCTEYVDALAIGAVSDPVPIPLKAINLLMPVMDIPVATAIEIQFYNYGIKLIGSVFLTQSPLAWLNSIPIVGDAAFVKINNTSGSIASFRLPFQLAM